MIKLFSENRSIVQEALKTNGVLLPVDDSDYTIEEKKAKGENLKFVYLENIPYCRTSHTSNVWAFDFELDEDKELFFTPRCHKMEKGIIVFTKDAAYIILIEMKSTLKGSGKDGIGPNGIEAKIKDSISKVAIFATPFVFGEKHSYIKNINFHSIIVYNNELVSKDALEDHSVKRYSLYQPFLSSKRGVADVVSVRSSIGKVANVKMHFLHNTNTDKKDYTIDVTDLINEPSFTSARKQEFSCP
jgi:hypothetical protein